MTEDKSKDDWQSVMGTNENNLFKLQCLIKATNIQYSVQNEFGKKLFLAIVTGNADIILYYKKNTSCTPIVKRIPWFQGSHKQISTVCFDPCGTWLLTASIDGSLYIIPALSLVDEECVIDKRWSLDDITSFPSIASQSSYSRPTALTWWQDIKTSINVAILGTEYGELVFINLENGHQIGIARVTGFIMDLQICRDKNNEAVSVLITNHTKQQWRLLLEHRTFSCLRHFENEGCPNAPSVTDMIYDNTKSFASTRSRLQGLKQLSVEKLTILRQKLAETRNHNLAENLRYNDTGNNKCSSLPTVNIETLSEDYIDIMSPEPISQDTFLTLQNDREGQQLYTCYHHDSNYVTVHGPDFSAVPLSVHKVFDSCENILLTHRFLFITDVKKHTIYVISDRMSEASVKKDSKFNPESIIDRFSFKDSKEIIRTIHKGTDFKNVETEKLYYDVDKKYKLPSNIKDINIEIPSIDTCLIVTNCSVYKVILRKSLLAIFLELVLKNNEIEKAGKLAAIFGMNAQQLLEYTGDILLLNKEFPRAIASYKLSKCRLLKSVLKFASAGHTPELLSCLTHCLISPAIGELSVATRIHLSNLCFLAFIETTLRATSHQSKIIYRDFLYFLSTNFFYDELLAVNIAGQTCLWEVLHYLATQRSLYGEMLEVLMKTIHLFGTSNSLPYGLLICLSESNLMQEILIKPDLARSHVNFVFNSLSDFQIFVLQRLVTLYDPTNPVLRPKLMQCEARRKIASHNSQSHDSIEPRDNNIETVALMEAIVETFILILLTLIRKKFCLNQSSNLICDVQLLKAKKQIEHANLMSTVNFKKRSLSAGFSHVALVRNGNVYTWGSAIQGCLGTGSSVLRYGTPKAIHFFQTMELEIFSVSCGHCHTLVVTNNGIYTWGSSQYGQLGLGKVLQCSNPELITSLAQEIIIDAVAGQYHSIALTVDGRIFTWGWGVHGQLGHGNTEKRNIPTLVTALLGVVIRQISAGHAHSLALSEEGILYAFGCNVFGQLGVNSTNKSSIPLKVLLSEKISLIATAYFHNLAVSNSNKLYVWGASPQVLRLQAQAQKKNRILEQQEFIEKQAENPEIINSEKQEPDLKNGNDTNEIGLESNVQRQNIQVNTTACNPDARRKQFEGTNIKNINTGLLEESQAHLTPCLIDTSLVKGQIVQVATGSHHNALLTKDGFLYTWGRNSDGQIGNGTKREVSIPTPLCCNPVSIFAQVPPRHNTWKRANDELELDANMKNIITDSNNGNITHETKLQHTETIDCKEKSNPIIRSLGICCGYDYTVAIQPGGTVLAWGNNNRAQLGRLPGKDTKDTDEKFSLLKSSKRVVRSLHTLEIPSQVPDIPAPIIAYQYNDISSLVGASRPLSVIEKLPGQLTLHYVLEHFVGLYDPIKIMNKCIELRNYQACSKIAILQNNFSDAFSYQLKALNLLNFQLSVKSTIPDSASETNICSTKSDVDSACCLIEDSNSSNHNLQKNTELFNKHVERNLIESVQDSAARNKMKIPASKSLNSLQVLEEDLYAFDYQGGSEEPCKEAKTSEISLDIAEGTLDSEINTDDTEVWIDRFIFEDDLSLEIKKVDTDSRSNVSQKSALITENTNGNIQATENRKDQNCIMPCGKEATQHRKNNLTTEAIKVLKFYLNEIENETVVVKCKILRSTFDFWIQHDLPIQSLENVFLEHQSNIFYPLGLLLFCQDIMSLYLDTNKNDVNARGLNMINLFSVKFCLQISSMLLQHIDKDEPTPEFIKILSSLMADHYGAPLTGYPGTSSNNTTKQMLEGLVSTVSNQESRSFIHIKDPDAVYRFLATEEDSMVFTCGHHYPLSNYETDIISKMETELLTSQSLLLPCTAQFLGKMLCQTLKPDTLCPFCIPRALETLVKKNNE